jgi:DNA-binding LytR/AlgR family response regulator
MKGPSASPVRVIGAGRVAICSGASTEVVDWADIILARSAKSYTWIVTRRGELRVRGSLQVVICALVGLGFVQIHRRFAVNDSKVRRLIRCGRRRLDILLEDDVRLEVGRQFQRSVRDRFGAERRDLVQRIAVMMSTKSRSAVEPSRRANAIG